MAATTVNLQKYECQQVE